MTLRRFVCVVVSATFVSFAALGNACFAETVFFDDFNQDGSPVGWYQWLGSGFVSDGALRITTDTGGTGVMRVLGLDLEETSIRAQGRLLDADANIDLIARHRPENQVNGVGSYFAGIQADGGVAIAIGGEAARIVEQTDTDLAPLEEDVVLQLDVMDNTVSFWAWRPGESMPLEPLLTYVDENDSQPFGDIAVASFSEQGPTLGGLFRYVHVANAHVPEPSAAFLLLSALSVLAAARQRRRS